MTADVPPSDAPFTLLTVVLPSRNPDAARLARTWQGLRQQCLPSNQWELLVVDSAGDPGNALETLDLSWHLRARRVRTDVAGLTQARLRGIEESRGDLLVFVDDDNVLAPNYLKAAWQAAQKTPKLGAFGGRNLAEWGAPPPPWIAPFERYLAVRDFGDVTLTSGALGEIGPEFSPVGAGMVVRRSVALRYASALKTDLYRASLDRSNISLASHGDHDLAWTSFDLGLEVGYVPELRLRHLIPTERTRREYLARLLYEMSRSWEVYLGSRGQRFPAQCAAGVVLRKLKHYWLMRAWQSTPAYLNWRAICGLLDGRRESSLRYGS